MNSGGREKFLNGSEVRILLLHGGVSEHIWIIAPAKEADEGDKYIRADRNGHVTVRQATGSKEQKVHFRRILPLEIDGKAPVIESSDKYLVVCPGCGCVIKVSPSDTAINCSGCNKITQVHWLGEKPMADAATKSAPKDKKAPKDKAPAKEKVVREPILVDFPKLVAIADTELWTKGHVKFDHPDVDVKAHALLFVNGEVSRKLCFNTYDGALGKKSLELPIEAFVTDGTAEGKRPKPWFAVKDIEKAREKLAKDGYELQK